MLRQGVEAFALAAGQNQSESVLNDRACSWCNSFQLIYPRRFPKALDTITWPSFAISVLQFLCQKLSDTSLILNRLSARQGRLDRERIPMVFGYHGNFYLTARGT